MRRELLLMVALVTVALGLGACSDQFEHVGSAAEATGTAKSSSVGGSAPVSATATPTRSASLVRVPAPTREQLQGCSTPGKRLCLVAFGDFPDDLLQVWANHLRATYGIEVEVLAPVDALDAWNPDRQQVLAGGRG